MTIVSASGLRAADLGGKSDPFAVVELNNISYETATHIKTLDPRWDETYVFNVLDITDILYITVYDKDILGVSECTTLNLYMDFSSNNTLFLAIVTDDII